MTREKRRVALATEQKRCRTNAAEFGGLKRICGPCNVRAAVVKRRRKKRMESLLQQGLLAEVPTNNGAARPTLSLNEPVDAGTPPLI